MRVAPLVILALLVLAAPASAQLLGHGLGGGLGSGGRLDLPSLPIVRDTEGLLARTTDDVSGRLDDLVTRRLDTAGDLLDRHPDVLEKSPQGDLIVRHEVLAYAPSDAALSAAAAAGFTVVSQDTLDGIGARVAVFDAPHGMSTHEALKRLHTLDPAGVYDYNDIYLGSASFKVLGKVSSSGPAGDDTAVHGEGMHGEGGGRVGLIDGGVDAGHPALHGADIEQKAFSGALTPSEHGTETASLLAGRTDGFSGAAPGAQLVVADIYGNAPTGGSTGALLRALDWMAQKHVAVINISLVGPPNEPLRAAVATLVGRGYLIVAAVGNDGPAAKPLYPASFPGVIGVTAVDRKNRVLMEAGRGPQVAFAAPGADIAAAVPKGAYAEVRGTSFAAPIVAGLLARQLSRPDPAEAKAAVAALAASASPLGAAAPNPVYGAGLVGGDIRPDLHTATTALKKKS